LKQTLVYGVSHNIFVDFMEKSIPAANTHGMSLFVRFVEDGTIRIENDDGC